MVIHQFITFTNSENRLKDLTYNYLINDAGIYLEDMPPIQASEDDIATMRLDRNKLVGETTQMGITTVGKGTIISTRVYPDLNIARLQNWLETYDYALREAHRLNPSDYVLAQGQTFQRMFRSFIEGSFNKDSEAIKAACKALKVKHTYKAINAYLRGV
jgi:hypothetical protein